MKTANTLQFIRDAVTPERPHPPITMTLRVDGLQVSVSVTAGDFSKALATNGLLVEVQDVSE